MPKLNIKIIAGSTREGRFSKTAAEWVLAQLKSNKDLQVELLDLADFDIPFFNEQATPSHKKEPYKHPAVAKFTNKIDEGDAFIVVTPEYNHSTSAVLKNALDWVYQEWNNKPVAFVSYGSVGGARAVEHLRLIAIELQMAPIRNSVHIPGELFFGTLYGGGDINEMLNSQNDKLEELTTQLIWWAKALKEARNTS